MSLTCWESSENAWNVLNMLRMSWTCWESSENAYSEILVKMLGMHLTCWDSRKNAYNVLKMLRFYWKCLDCPEHAEIIVKILWISWAMLGIVGNFVYLQLFGVYRPVKNPPNGHFDSRMSLLCASRMMLNAPTIGSVAPGNVCWPLSRLRAKRRWESVQNVPKLENRVRVAVSVVPRDVKSLCSKKQMLLNGLLMVLLKLWDYKKQDPKYAKIGINWIDCN